MENQNNPQTNISTPSTTPTANSIAKAIAQKEETVKKVNLNCNIRLKPGMISVPGQSEEDFNYYFSSILAKTGGGPLKGVTGEVERMIMPSIIDVSTNDNNFNSRVRDYWINFSDPLPVDTVNKRDVEQGIVIKIYLKLLVPSAIKAFEELSRIEDRYNYVYDLLDEQLSNPNSTKKVLLEVESYADFIKLGFALKHSRIANRVEHKDNSPKIFGYIYEKTIAVKAQETEMATFTTFSTNMQNLEDEKQINAILVAIKEPVVDGDSIVDKKLTIYNRAKGSHDLRVEINKLIVDTNWEYKYYIEEGLSRHILKRPPNSTLIQYGDSIIGNDLPTAAEYIKTDIAGQTILEIIKNALKLK